MTTLQGPRLIVARQLGVDPSRIDPDTPLASYGLDSLRSLELVAALEDATGQALPESFCVDHPTLNALTCALNGTSVEAPPWEADLALAASLDVAPGDVAREPQNVFLTGATGLVGAYLLRTLIDHTEAQVWCLVRAAPGEGLARIRANLTAYRLWDDAVARRLQIVRGDLGLANFGLPAAEYLGIAAMTDAVMHAAADVDWVQPYAALRRVNVLGTLEVLRLAGAVRRKAVQFISSLSVCYVPGGPPAIDPLTDCVPYIGRLPLGYAQTKCVAEALCDDASRQGLPVRVIRPALVAGDSRTGVSNAEDLIGRLVRGCIEMRAAPDLEWSFDAVPADELARVVVAAPWPGARAFERVHLMSPRPRTWQECVLWINVLGHHCRLLPFAAWRDQLAWAARSTAHPLAPLRTFFAAGRDGASPAELCQASRHSAVTGTGLTPGASGADAGGQPLGFDAPMLARQIDGYAKSGALRRGGRTAVVRDDRPPLWQRRDDLAAVLRQTLGPALVLHAVDAGPAGSSLGILSDLSSWRRGRDVGVRRYQLTVEQDGRVTKLPVVIKAKAHDEDALDAARALAAMCGEDVEREVVRFERAIGLEGAGDREVALYQHATGPLRRVMPRCYGSWCQSHREGAGLILEDLGGSARLDATCSSEWTAAGIRTTLEGLATIHASGLEMAAGEMGAVLRPMRGAGDVRRMMPLWEALAGHAAPAFADAAGPTLPRRHASLVAAIDRWTRSLEASPATLVHHDFSPRNAAIRQSSAGRSLVAYDWELATLGLPQRDLAEFLCFVLPPDAAAADVARLVEEYRRLLERATERSWPREAWRDGFCAALALLLVDRLAFYALIARVRPPRFLPGVLRSWQRIDAIASSAAFAGDRS